MGRNLKILKEEHIASFTVAQTPISFVCRKGDNGIKKKSCNRIQKECKGQDGPKFNCITKL